MSQNKLKELKEKILELLKEWEEFSDGCSKRTVFDGERLCKRDLTCLLDCSPLVCPGKE